MPRLLLNLTKIVNTKSKAPENQNLFITAACSLYPKQQVLQSALFAGPNPSIVLPKDTIEKTVNLSVFDIPCGKNDNYEFEFSINLYQTKERLSVWKSLPLFENLYAACDKKNFNGIIPPEPEKQLSAFVPQLLSRTSSHLRLGKESVSYKSQNIPFGNFRNKISSTEKILILKMNDYELFFEWEIVEKRCYFETQLVECQILNEFDDEIYCQMVPDNNPIKEGFGIKQFLAVGDSSDKHILKTFNHSLNFSLLEADSGVVSIFDKDDIIGTFEINRENMVKNGKIEFSGEEGAYYILYESGVWT